MCEQDRFAPSNILQENKHLRSIKIKSGSFAGAKAGVDLKVLDLI